MWRLVVRKVVGSGPGGARSLVAALTALPACAGLLWLLYLVPPTVNSGVDQRATPGGSVPGLPPLGSLGVFSSTMVEQAYLFAAEHPEVMDAIPCSCGCARAGHISSTECFVKTRGTDGRVGAWEPHGARCAICVDIARVSRKLHGAGEPIERIRSEVVGLWGDSTAPRP